MQTESVKGKCTAQSPGETHWELPLSFRSAAVWQCLIHSALCGSTCGVLPTWGAHQRLGVQGFIGAIMQAQLTLASSWYPCSEVPR